jgi:NADPH:quinone reductase-like Zn-dependent oxidoreductase
MRALRLFADRDLRLVEIEPPAPPQAGEARVRIAAVALNHIDVWGYRGMAFAKRTLPITVGVEGVGTVEAVGPDADTTLVGKRVAVYGGLTCGTCRACRAGRDNLCEAVSGILGFHVDGLAAEVVTVPARLLIPVPDEIGWVHAAAAPLTFATVQHMLFDNAKLEPGETILVHAAGSGIGSTAILMAKKIGATVIATAGSDEKVAKALALGADHAINYRTDRFETKARRLTGKRGVDVVFEHIGPDTWAGSLLALARGGRLVTCGSTTGVSAPTNLMHLYQQQIRIFASFGASLRNVREGLDQMAAGVLPVIDSELALADIAPALARLESRDVFGKIVVRIG